MSRNSKQKISTFVNFMLLFTPYYLARYFDIFYRLAGMYRNEKAVDSEMDKQLRIPLNDLVPYENCKYYNFYLASVTKHRKKSE